MFQTNEPSRRCEGILGVLPVEGVARQVDGLFQIRRSKLHCSQKLKGKEELFINWDSVIYVTDISDRACACLKSVLRLGVDKDHRISNWVLILYQTCTTIEMNCRQELKIV